MASEPEQEAGEPEETIDDSRPLTEEERQKLFEAAKSAMTRTS